MKDNLDGFILNLFRTEKPKLSKEDFENENTWVCDLLDQDIDLAKEYTAYKLKQCKNRMEKLEFLYVSISCFKSTIRNYEYELDPNSHGYSYYNHMDREELNHRLSIYQHALHLGEQAICYYMDCSKLECEDQEEPKTKFKLSTKKGSKIDLIRVLNSLYELRFITNEDGTIPNKSDFMIECGKLFGTDLSKYHTNLSQALQSQPLEVNLKIFEDLKKVIQDQHYTNKK